MSVQSGRTYEQEFALEIAKAKVRTAARLLPVTAAKLCRFGSRKSSAVKSLQRRVCPTQEGKVKNTPWGSSFRAPQQILHGKLPVKQALASSFLQYAGCLKWAVCANTHRL